MPQDNRRFNGPETSFPYQNFVKLKGDGPFENINNDTSKNSSSDLFVKTGVVSQAKGSSYVELKQTIIVCSVFDPREIPHQNEFSKFGDLYCELKFAPWSCPGGRRPPQPDQEEKALSVAIKQALEPAVCRHLFPNFQVDIYLYVLQNAGSCLSAAIIAAGIALADAAVPMFDLITSATIAVRGTNKYINPSFEEELLCTNPEDQEANHGIITLSYLRELKQITDVKLMGCVSEESVISGMDTLLSLCVNAVPVVQQSLIKTVTRGLKELAVKEKVEKEREDKIDEKIRQFVEKTPEKKVMS